MIKSDILIIGAGPVGLFAVFEAGLLKMKCHLIDILPKPGGQCIELYPKKPIYDIPGYPEILAGDLIDNLLKQCSQFEPGFTLGEKADKLEKQNDGSFIVTTNKGTKHHAPIVVIAGGLGGFQPRKPNFDGIESFEEKGVSYFIKEPNIYIDKNVIISGGGDSALDWTIELSKVAKKVTLVHRRNEFRGASDSVDKVQKLKDENKINLITPAEVFKLEGTDNLEKVFVKKENPISTTSESTEENSKNLNDILGKGLKVGLNDRLAFIKNLFNGSVEEYQRVISQIQTYDELEEAQNFIENLVKPDYNYWEGKESFESRFIKIIEQNFD